MNYSKRFLTYLFAVLLCACTTPTPQVFAPQNPQVFAPPTDYVPIKQVQIPSRFSTVEVTKENLGIEVNKCVPQLNLYSEGVRKHLVSFPGKDLIGFGHVSSSKIFLLQRTTAICLQKSSEKFPIFASETFLDTINPQGVPPDVVEEWYRQIALLIATKGMARVAYVFKNGNASITSYWVENQSSFSLNYSRIFEKKGEWEKEGIDAEFIYPTMTSVSETKRSDMSKKHNPISHRIQ